MDQSGTPRLESSLDMPLGSLLPHIQHRIMTSTSWLGVPTLKSPYDAWVYQELIYEVQPTTIIEVGIYNGGSTLYLASLCDMIGVGKVLGVDLHEDQIEPRVKEHDRIELFIGDAIEMAPAVASQIDASGPVLVIEDSAHTYENTLEVCRLYGDFVTSGSYLIVEDTICHHGLDVGPNPGPFEAAAAFLEETEDFILRRDLESFAITWNPAGYLQKK